jgi:hypothetical protein
MVAFKKSNPEKKIIFLGTQHVGAPRITYKIYRDIISSALKDDPKTLLRPENCFLKFSPLNAIKRYLFSRNILKPGSGYLSKSVNKFRKALKTDEGKIRFDNMMLLKDEKDKKSSVSVITLIQSRLINDSGSDSKVFLDFDLMYFFDKMKCSSLDNNVRFSRYNKNVETYYQQQKIQKRIFDKSVKEMDDNGLLNLIQGTLSMNHKSIIIKQLNLNETANMSATQKVLLDARNQAWSKKLVSCSEKMNTQIALVGASHIRTGPNSLKSIFKRDPEWKIYDMKYFHSKKTKTSDENKKKMIMKQNIILKLMQSRNINNKNVKEAIRKINKSLREELSVRNEVIQFMKTSEEKVRNM